MQIPVILRPGESGWFVASAPTMPGCHSQGQTREEALANIQEAIELWLEDEAGNGQLNSPDIYELVEINIA